MVWRALSKGSVVKYNVNGAQCGVARRLAWVAAVSFPFPNPFLFTPSPLLPNFFAHPRRVPSLARFPISAPPGKGECSAVRDGSVR